VFVAEIQAACAGALQVQVLLPADEVELPTQSVQLTAVPPAL